MGSTKIAKRMAKTNQDIFGEQCTRNDDGMLIVKGEENGLKIICMGLE